MKLKTAVKIAIACFSANLFLGIITRFVFYNRIAPASKSIWVKNAFSFVSFLQIILLYGPLILFMAVLHSKLGKQAIPGKPPAVSSEKNPESVAKHTSERKGSSVARGFLLALGFMVLGIIAIVVSWGILGSLADSAVSKDVAMRLIYVVTVAIPVLIWGVIFLLTRSLELPLRHDLRLYSAVGFFLAVAIAWIGISPLAVLGIAFKGVRM